MSKHVKYQMSNNVALLFCVQYEDGIVFID